MSITESTPTTSRGRVRVEPGHKRVRAYLRGHLVADTLRPLLVWETPHYPAYYIPLADVRAELVPAGEGERSPSRGTPIRYDVVTPAATAAGAARRYADSPIEPLREAVRLDWAAMDEWLEEDEPVYTHPRDPYTRVDALASSREVRVEVDGVTVAQSRSAVILFETGLPPRYYLPMSDVRMDLLTPTERRTHCPYKGTAEYWSLRLDGRTHEDLVWAYRTPLPESQKIAGRLCFYTERVDLYLDGLRQ